MSGAAEPSPAGTRIALGGLIAAGLPLFDRSGRDEQTFQLYAAAAFLRGAAAIVRGRDLRGRLVSVRAGDVLVSRAAADPRRAWVVADHGPDQALATGEWLVLRSPVHDPAYLRHVLVSNEFHLRFMHALSGAAAATAASPRLRAIELPVPPRPVQAKWAAVLDCADRLRAMRRRAASLVDDLESLPDAESGSGAVPHLKQHMARSRERLDALTSVLRDLAFRDDLGRFAGAVEALASA